MANSVEQNMRAMAAQIRNGLPGASRAGAKVIAAEVVRRAPSKTGQLKKDVYVKTVRTTSGSVVSVVKIRRRSHGWIYSEFGTSHQPARPFIRPAAESQKELAKEAVIHTARRLY